MSETASGSSTPPADDPYPGTGDVAATGTKGGGEWPDPATRPTGAAPGSDPERAAALQAERQERTTDGDGPGDELHPPVERDDVYADGGDTAAVGSVGGAGADEPEEEAQDAGAARNRGPAPIGQPRTEQT